MSYQNTGLYNDILMGANIVSGDEYKEILYAISRVTADMVVKTLGPYGCTTIIDDSAFTYPSKDGWACLSRLRFNDPMYNSLFKILRQISFNIVSKVGDGTTSAIIGANEFLKLLMEYQSSNTFRQADFIQELNGIQNEIITNLNNSEDIKYIDQEGDFEDIRKIAYISSNSNEEISDIVQNIYKATKNSNIYVSIDPGNKLDYEIQVGYKFDCKTLNHRVYVNEESGMCHKAKPSMVAIFDHNLNYNEHGVIIELLSKYAAQMNNEIIIFAPHYDDILINIIDEGIKSCIQRKVIPNIMLVQYPLSMDIHRQYLSDFVMLTNGKLFDYGKCRACYGMHHNLTNTEADRIKDAILEIDQYKFESPQALIEACVGTVNNILIAENYCIIKEYEDVVNPDLYQTTLRELDKQYNMLKDKKNKSTSVLNKEYMDVYQRYTRLVGNMGIIKVGGNSDLEKFCLKDSVDDAVLACKSAYDNGYVRGLNLAIIKTIGNLPVATSDKPSVRNAILQMLYQTFVNIGVAVLKNKYNTENITRNHPVIEGRLTNTCADIIIACADFDLGYNLITDSYEGNNGFTVINSVSTDIEILNAIISILSLVLTSNQFLSISRMYDRKKSREILLTEQIEDKIKVNSAVLKGVLQSFNI